ncbi:MAG: hypothetical protein ACFFAS_13935 [Promethearchaeota archaeon]
MPEKANPPTCFSCSRNFEKSLDALHYCICDIAICANCISSVQKNDSTWICPNCKTQNSIEKSKLIRE